MKQKKNRKFLSLIVILSMFIMTFSMPMTAGAEGAGIVDPEFILGYQQWHRECREGLTENPNVKFSVVDLDGDGKFELITDEGVENGWFVIEGDRGVIRLQNVIDCSVGYSCLGDTYLMMGYLTDGEVYGLEGEKEIWFLTEWGAGVPNVNAAYAIIWYEEEGVKIPLTEACETADDIERNIDYYMENSMELKAEYDVTEENLNRFLPIDEESIVNIVNGQATTVPVSLNVGEVLMLNSGQINALIANAGLIWQDSPYATIYYGDAVEIGEKLVAVSCIDVNAVLKNSFECVDSLYLTDDEWPAVLEKWKSGELAKQYGAYSVDLVDVAEGMPYFVRAEEAGETSVVIKAHQTGKSGRTIEVTIPIKITAAPSGISGSAGTGESKTVVTLEDAKGVLPKGASMEIAPIENSQIVDKVGNLDIAASKIGLFKGFEIDVLTSMGVKLHQLMDKVVFEMKMPFAISEGSSLKVFRVDGDTAVECAAKIVGDKVQVETDHFSTYIFVEVRETANVGAGTTGTTSPKTADGLQAGMYVGVMIVGLALCGVVVYTKKRHA